MSEFSITDNHQGKSFQDLTIEDFNNFQYFSNYSLEELVNKNPQLLIFPKELNSFNDGIGELSICNIKGVRDDLRNVKISTGNLMGFVGYGNTKLTIHSRFDRDNEKDLFLHYMLQKVMSLNMINVDRNVSEDGQFDFLIYLFPIYLKKALKQGLYKEYKTFKHNDLALKGSLSISEHLRKNMPFKGTMAYTSRERSFDNSILQLIRHTIEYLKTKDLGQYILKSDSEIRAFINLIVENTHSYSAQARNKVLQSTLRDINHPYFTEYVLLQRLCRMILRHKKLNYGTDSRKVYGVLFDGAWLWEEYLSKVLNKVGFTHAENKKCNKWIELYSGVKRYPDFYKGNQLKEEQAFILDVEKLSGCAQKNFILDAKYKKLDSFSVNREDLHQIITYMHILPANRGGLIYPLERKTIDTAIVESKKELYGFGGSFSTYGITIPQNMQTVRDFYLAMRQTEDKIINIFTEIL